MVAGMRFSETSTPFCENMVVFRGGREWGVLLTGEQRFILLKLKTLKVMLTSFHLSTRVYLPFSFVG